MTKDEAREILIAFNKWHRGEYQERFIKPNPEYISQAIDCAIQALGETIKPYHEHGNSVASDRTESGQSAEDVLTAVLIEEYPQDEKYCKQAATLVYRKHAIKAMRLHASQVCADKDRESSLAFESLKFAYDNKCEQLQSELLESNQRIKELEAKILSFMNELKTK